MALPVLGAIRSGLFVVNSLHRPGDLPPVGSGRVGKEKVNSMKLLQALKNGVRQVVDFVDRNTRKVVAVVVGVGAAVVGGLAQAQTDATVIATNAQTAFGVIAPITITIAGFYVILKIAKKVVH